jgi:hypothetical protein
LFVHPPIIIFPRFPPIETLVMFNSTPPHFGNLLLPVPKNPKSRLHQRSHSDSVGDKHRDEIVSFPGNSSFTPPTMQDDLSDYIKRPNESKRMSSNTSSPQSVILKASTMTFQKMEIDFPSEISLLTDLLTKHELKKTMIPKHHAIVHLTDIANVHFKLEINITKRTTGFELITKAMTMAMDLHKKLIFQDPNAYILRVSKGSVVDQDIPLMERKVPIMDCGFTQFVLLADPNYKYKPKMKKDIILEDVMLLVEINDKEMSIHISPDILIQDLFQILCRRLDIVKENYYMNLIMNGIPENPSNYKLKTIKGLNVDHLELVQIVKPEKDDQWVYLNQDQILRQTSTFVFPTINLDTISEYRVFLLKKFAKEEIKLGFDTSMLFHEVSQRSLFGKEQKIIALEKSISTLLNVTKSELINKKFILKFIEEELSYETKTVVESDEIVKQLKQILDINVQKRNQTGFYKRKSSSLSDLSVSLQDVPTIIKSKKDKLSPIPEKNALSILKKDIRNWNISDVGIWLDAVGFGFLKDKFAEEVVDGEVLIKLTLNDLGDDFHLQLDPRKKLYARIADLREQMKKKTSLFNNL